DPHHNLWQVTRKIKRPRKRAPPVQRPDDSWCRTDADRANAFAVHLEKVFSPNRRCTAEHAANVALQLVEPPIPAEPYPPVTEEEIAQHIVNAKSRKAPGDDGINAAALKILPPSTIKLITTIFNKCLDLGYFPTPWKRARVVMIPKPVPQGSVLGPILYNAYTADLPAPNNGNLIVATYADDTALLARADTPAEAACAMQRHLDQLNTWHEQLNIAINSDKSTATTFT
ncbi:hypothetical protein KR018_004058, partial [Drosophila ironensis]